MTISDSGIFLEVDEGSVDRAIRAEVTTQAFDGLAHGGKGTSHISQGGGLAEMAFKHPFHEPVCVGEECASESVDLVLTGAGQSRQGWEGWDEGWIGVRWEVRESGTGWRRGSVAEFRR